MTPPHTVKLLTWQRGGLFLTSKRLDRGRFQPPTAAPGTRVVLDGVDQTFTAPQKLVSPDFSSLKIGGNLNMTDVSSYVNGLDLDLFDRRRVTVSTDQWIKGAWMVDNISGDTLSFRTLNGLTVNEWNSSFVHAHSPTAQIIHADGFDIHLLEVGGSITTSLNRINGYDLHGLSQVAGDIQKNLGLIRQTKRAKIRLNLFILIIKILS